MESITPRMVKARQVDRIEVGEVEEELATSLEVEEGQTSKEMIHRPEEEVEDILATLAMDMAITTAITEEGKVEEVATVEGIDKLLIRPFTTPIV